MELYTRMIHFVQNFKLRLSKKFIFLAHRSSPWSVDVKRLQVFSLLDYFNVNKNFI
jgi:hypothetical protein